MTTTILTPAGLRNASTQIMEKQIERAMHNAAPYCLVVITMKDGTTQEIMAKLHPRDLHEIGAELTRRGGLTLDNGDNAILVMADQIKHINVMKVTSKE